MSDYIDSVNNILVILNEGKGAHEQRGNRDRAIEFAKHIQNLRAFIKDYERLEAATRPIPVVNGDDLSDLPPELLKELSTTKTDELETQIITIINASGKVADIDTILIYLFRRFEVVQTRRFLQNKLWRMAQKEIIWSVEGKKGLYTTTPQTAQTENLEVESGHTDPDDTFDDESEIPF